LTEKIVRELYKEIQNILFKLIPEKWERLYLYASVVNEKGEMYFYYFPKKTILKANPINCYEIASKFGIDEEQYNAVLKELYNKIKQLHNLAIKKWTNITISIANCLFTAEYNYSNLYTDEQRHIYWKYKYLNAPIESFSKKDQEFIKYYDQEYNKNTYIYTEGIYINKTKETMKNLNNQSLEKTNEIKNQILKC